MLIARNLHRNIVEKNPDLAGTSDAGSLFPSAHAPIGIRSQATAGAKLILKV